MASLFVLMTRRLYATRRICMGSAGLEGPLFVRVCSPAIPPVKKNTGGEPRPGSTSRGRPGTVGPRPKAVKGIEKGSWQWAQGKPQLAMEGREHWRGNQLNTTLHGRRHIGPVHMIILQ